MHRPPTPSSPDVTITSAHLALELVWRTHTTLNSDHLPITISSTGDSPPTRTRKSYTNFNKANWTLFTTLAEELFQDIPAPVTSSGGTKTFNATLLTASKRSIPAGFRKDFNPALSSEVRDLIETRDHRRHVDPADPSITILNAEITRITTDTARSKWRDTVSSLSHRTHPKKFWNLIKSLSGKSSRQPPNQPISFLKVDGNHCTCTKPSAIANRFNKAFTTTSTHKHNPESRKVIRSIHKTHKLDNSFEPFSNSEVSEAIKNSRNSTATGPDNLTILHLKHLGPHGLSFLRRLFNLSVSRADFPAIWKQARIIPILKPNKPADEGKSYRPISLLCPASKVLERLVLPYLTDALPPNHSQHGFRPAHSTTTALLPLATMIATGFNQRKPPSRTAALAVDIAKAFDSVNHTLLLRKINLAPLHSNLVRWITAYIRGRTAFCNYLSATSTIRIIRSGVPQGSVISPCLFNFFLSDAPISVPMTSSYADDVTIAVSHPEISMDARELSPALTRSFLPLVDWATTNGLNIAPEKSTVTLFTPWTKQYNTHPQVTLNNELVPLNKTPKILGVTFDPMNTFSPHISSIAARASSRLQILKALAGTSWGQDKETIMLTFNSIIKPIITYAAPIWFPNASRSSIERLQRIQNKALRIGTGSLMMSEIHHLHSEGQMLPIEHHLRMLCTQFLASALRPHHPSHQLVRSDPGPRAASRCPLLQTAYLSDIQHLLEPDGSIDRDSYRLTLNSIHTDRVTTYLASRSPNRVLGILPPDIADEETQLPRHYRTTLSQLRSGHCSRLNDYRARINLVEDDICPECHTAPHSVGHIFRCTAAPTELTEEDLWRRPIQVAHFLSSLAAFDALPPLVPPPPRPPPEPPPGGATGD